MKNLIYTTIIILILSSCKKEIVEKVRVVMDCTGTYLNYNGKDYRVCNREKVASFPDGTTVTATFKKIKECNGSAKNDIVCMMFHESEGWIEVEKIN